MFDGFRDRPVGSLGRVYHFVEVIIEYLDSGDQIDDSGGNPLRLGAQVNHFARTDYSIAVLNQIDDSSVQSLSGHR